MQLRTNEGARRRLLASLRRVAYGPGPLSTVGSTDRCNTLDELLRRRLIEHGLSWSLVELPGDGIELGLAVQRQVRAARQILAQQSVSVSFEPRRQGDRGSQK